MISTQILFLIPLDIEYYSSVIGLFEVHALLVYPIGKLARLLNATGYSFLKHCHSSMQSHGDALDPNKLIK